MFIFKWFLIVSWCIYIPWLLLGIREEKREKTWDEKHLEKLAAQKKKEEKRNKILLKKRFCLHRFVPLTEAQVRPDGILSYVPTRYICCEVCGRIAKKPTSVLGYFKPKWGCPYPAEKISEGDDSWFYDNGIR